MNTSEKSCSHFCDNFAFHGTSLSKAHMIRTWRERISEPRYDAEMWLGHQPEALRKRWVTSGVDEQKLYEAVGFWIFLVESFGLKKNDHDFYIKPYGNLLFFFFVKKKKAESWNKQNDMTTFLQLKFWSNLQVPKGCEEWTIVETIFWSEPKDGASKLISSNMTNRTDCCPVGSFKDFLKIFLSFFSLCLFFIIL